MSNEDVPVVIPPEVPETGFVLSETWYNRLKWFTLTVLPAFGTLYFALSDALGLPYTTQVLGTTSALATFIGTILGFSTRTYNKSEARYAGDIKVTESDTGGVRYSIELRGEPKDDINPSKEIILKVNNQLPPPPPPVA